MITVTTTGRKVIGALKRYQLVKRQAVVNALNKGALKIRNTVILSMKKTPRRVFGPDVAPPPGALDDRTDPRKGKKPKKGKLLKRGKKLKSKKRKSRGHLPSTPGHPPAIDTGRLVGSIAVDFAQPNALDPIAKVSTPVEYAVPLEYGRTGNKRKTRRPFMRPAFNKHLAEIRADVKRAMKGVGVF